MSKSLVSAGVTTLDIIGYPISVIPAGESAEVIENIHLCAAATAAAPAVIVARMGMDPEQANHFASATAAQTPTAVGSNGGDTPLRTMQAGSMSVPGGAW